MIDSFCFLVYNVKSNSYLKFDRVFQSWYVLCHNLSKEDIMKKSISVIVALVLSVGFAGNAFADRNVRWSHHGGYQPNQNYNGGYYDNHRHGGHGGGWIAPLILGAGVGYLLTRPQQPPVIVDDNVPSLRCEQVQQRVTDRQGRPLYDQYTGQPLTRWVQACPAVVR